MFQLEFPNISHKSRYLDMIKEWGDFENPDSPGALFHGKNYEEFLENRENDLVSNFFGVPATLFFFMRDSEILGAIQIRHTLDHPDLARYHGNIGYGLRPSARGKGLARDMLSLGLREAKKLGLKEVIISANEDNPASWKTIERCGGIFLKTIEKDNKSLKIYQITL